MLFLVRSNLLLWVIASIEMYRTYKTYADLTKVNTAINKDTLTYKTYIHFLMIK